MTKIIVLLFIAVSLIAVEEEYLGKQMYTQVGMWYEEGKSYEISVNTSKRKVLGKELTKKYSAYSRLKTNLAVNSTNFGRGTFIPVNTPVIVLRISNDNERIYLGVQDKVIMLFNREEFTKLSDEDFIRRYISNKKIDLSEFSDTDLKNILGGRVRIGMSKDAVRLTRGYPPLHKTPNLESNKWRYWEESMHSHYYYFKDGKFDGKD